MTERSLDRPFRALRDKAADEGKSLDESFLDELENYTRHIHVAELAARDLEKVVLTIGRRAIEQTPVAKVGAKSIRVILNTFCSNPFSTCYDAARAILEKREGDQKDVKRLLGKAADELIVGYGEETGE